MLILKIMKQFSAYIIGLFIIMLAFSCKKKETYRPMYYTQTYTPAPDTTNWTYNGTGDGNVSKSKDVEITFPIQSNLNVNGTAQLGTNAIIRNDLNLNSSGKVVVRATFVTDTIYLNGNVNVNDSLLIQRGIVKVARDFNINSLGFVNCSDSAQIIIGGSLNQAGTLWGNKFVKAEVKNINNPDLTFDNPNDSLRFR